MAVTATDQDTATAPRTLPKFARVGAGGALTAGALALLLYARSEQGKQRMVALFGAQYESIEGQIQAAVRENMPLIEEAIDRLIDTLQQGVSSLSDEINRLGGEAKQRISQYAALAEHAGAE